MKKLKISLLLVMIAAGSFAQELTRIPLIGEEAPKFRAKSTTGTINFPKDFGTHWKIIFSHPMDFTPVCSSELLELANLQDDFKDLNVDIIVVSTDTLYQHYNWKEQLEKIAYKGRDPVKINFPMVDDENRRISSKYGMLHENISTTKDVRGVFVIDPDNIIRLIQFYPTEIGRNMNEIKRTILALQESDEKNVLLPANWEPGDDVLLRGFDDNILSDPAVYQLDWFMTFKKM